MWVSMVYGKFSRGRGQTERIEPMAKYYVEYSLGGVKSRLKNESETLYFDSIKDAWLGLFGSLYTANKSLDEVEAVEIKEV
ncbi:hypothetical protein LCGC14_1801200 [marine sediment metagenome]|uniref:Uncharacterized protein n=1 Tax=marine sediment metagenome TaxID=412755 RepID=A0A0F9JPA8_9ZZZZ